MKIWQHRRRFSLGDRRYRHLVVLNLAWLHHEELLRALFDPVLAPPKVREEFERLVAVDARFKGLRFPGFIEIATPKRIPATLVDNSRLDPGETAAFALALERSISVILIDDAAGRTAARGLGLQPAGLLAVLIEAKKRWIIAEVLPLLDRLQVGARFYVDIPLRRRIAALTGEEFLE